MRNASIRLIATTILLGAASACHAQDRAQATEFGPPPTETWPTYNGDYSGRRYSELSQINAETVNQLALQWTYQIGRNSSGGRNELAFGADQKYATA